MSDETTPGPDLRERIAEALAAEHFRRTRQGLLTSPEIHNAALAGAVLAAVQAELDRRDAAIAVLLAQLPSDGQGHWRQGSKNPRNCYVHQGDDEVGKPVGQMYSAQLAALVCDAVNAQQTRGRSAADVELVLADLRQRTERAETEAAKLRGWDESLSGRLTKELAEAKAEIERLNYSLRSARVLLGRALSDDPAEALVRRLDQMHTAWWSARIGRAMARLTLDRTRDALSEAIVEEQELLRAAEAERDQLKAAIARVREIHPRETTGHQDVCGSCFDERENQFTWPCPTIAALDRPVLPAVRDFAAKHDPREEPK